MNDVAYTSLPIELPTPSPEHFFFSFVERSLNDLSVKNAACSEKWVIIQVLFR